MKKINFLHARFVLHTNILCAKNMRKNGDYYGKRKIDISFYQ